MASEYELVCGDVGPSGAYVVSWGQGGVWAFSANIPSALYEQLFSRPAEKPGVSSVSLGPQGGFFVQFSDGEYFCECPPGAMNDIENMTAAPRHCEFGSLNGSYVLLFADGTVTWDNVPFQLGKLLQRRYRDVCDVALGEGGAYFVLFSDGSFLWRNLPVRLVRALEQAEKVQFVRLSCDSRNYVAKIDGRIFLCGSQELENSASDWLDISTLRYSQEVIWPHFSDGYPLQAAINDLLADSSEDALFAQPKLRVVKAYGKFYTLDNRQLHCYQQAGIPSVPVTHVPINQHVLQKLAHIDGTSVRLRDGPKPVQTNTENANVSTAAHKNTGVSSRIVDSRAEVGVPAQTEDIARVRTRSGSSVGEFDECDDYDDDYRYHGHQ